MPVDKLGGELALENILGTKRLILFHIVMMILVIFLLIVAWICVSYKFPCIEKLRNMLSPSPNEKPRTLFNCVSPCGFVTLCLIVLHTFLFILLIVAFSTVVKDARKQNYVKENETAVPFLAPPYDPKNLDKLRVYDTSQPDRNSVCEPFYEQLSFPLYSNVQESSPLQSVKLALQDLRSFLNESAIGIKSITPQVVKVATEAIGNALKGKLEEFLHKVIRETNLLNLENAISTTKNATETIAAGLTNKTGIQSLTDLKTTVKKITNIRRQLLIALSSYCKNNQCDNTEASFLSYVY
ncbi:hypothetical protein Ciccas_013674 [Cichlidogyrus casuarinus]|uniref:Uncharacterized protein n=1 Tax=Cichlidogyrus casuarinus TaxID=1844966 RepID=A0ABD2PLG7_9PLAT